MATTVTYETGGYPLPGAELDWPNPGEFPLEVVESLNPRELEGTSLMVAATVIDESSMVHIPYPPLMNGETDWPIAGEFSVTGASEKVYIAGNVGITTKPEDDPANTVIHAGLVGKLNFSNSLFADTDPMLAQGVTSQSGRGALLINDPAGSLDYLAPLSFDGALLEIYRGRHADLRSTWSRIGNMTTQGILFDGVTKSIRLRDAGWKLDNNEIQPIRYGGGGGVDGDSSLRGTCKPYGMGYCPNVSLLIINTTLLIGQVSNSSIYAVYDVRDGGSSLTFSTDYATYALLAANAPAAGYYHTCRALGLIRLGALATKQVTVDFSGDSDTLNGKAYPITRADMVRRIACGLGYNRLDGSTELDQASFQYLNDYYPDELGFWWNQPITKASAIAEIMAGLSGYAVVRFDGKLTIGPARLADTDASAYLTLTFPNNMLGTPRLLSYSPPRQATYVGWQRNYTPQTRDQLQTGVTEAAATIYANPLRVEGSVSAANATVWPTSQIVTVNGGFRYQAAADLEASRQQTIFGTRRERWGVTVPMDQFANVLARRVDLLGWNRYNFADGRALRCVAITANDTLNLILELWG